MVSGNVEGILSGCCRDILVTEDGYKPSPSRPCGVYCGELSALGAPEMSWVDLRLKESFN